MTTLAEAYAVDCKLDLGLASLGAVFRLNNRSQGIGRLTFLVTGWVGLETAFSVFVEERLDGRSETKLFAYHRTPDSAR